MKTISKLALVLMALSCTVFFVSGQTLKERIDEAKVVKVYFKNAPIAHLPHTTPPIGSNLPGTGCEAFGETTPLPAEYTDAVNGLLEVLNTGFKTTAFVAGDFSKVPARTSGMLKGEPDWVSVGEPLMFFVSTWGEYVVNMTQTGKMNSMAIQSYLIIYTVKDGKVKILDQKQLAYNRTEPISTQKCDNYAYFTEHFPAASLAEPFKTELNTNMNELIAKDMKKYEKAMSKKK